MNDRILRALRREPVDCTPVWFMRQAGRALPKYREKRADRDMFALLRDPPAAAEITVMPLEYFPVDAAVLYNDLVTPFFGAGIDLRMEVGVGPVVGNPIQTPADIDRLTPFDPRIALDWSLKQIRLVRTMIDVPVLGFIGAPFTLCSYLIKGKHSRQQEEIKEFIWRDPSAWHTLAGFWTDHLAEYGIAQYEAGAAAIQVFDSWVGSVGPEDYEEHIFPHTSALFQKMGDAGVPTIHFFTGNPALLPLIADAGGDAISVDWRLPIDVAWDMVGEERAIQGNLDPVVLLAGRTAALPKVRAILDRIGGRPGHIFNLGHGILPGTDHEVIRAVAEFVHEYDASKVGA
ncbi:MAG TPA: uroporphyrinogen decarboxylase [Longimicrobiales bacterium]|nr:uroporphyrinogen decarboxylase [Longimicrobiales bacterium]